MDADEPPSIIKAGYLHVKLPAGVRGIGKAWTHRWVIVKPYKITDGQKTSTGILFEILKSDKVASSSPTTEKVRSPIQVAHKRHVSTKDALFLRSYSRKQPYAFTAAEGKEPVLHLAGNSESETQQWMATLRNALWPPNQLVQLEKVLSGNLYEVSFIDNSCSHKASLLGCYGYFCVCNKKVTLFCPPTGHVIQEWYLDTINVAIVPQLATDDANKVFSMQTARVSSTGENEFFLYSPEAETLVKTIREAQNNLEKPSTHYHDDLTEVASLWAALPCTEQPYSIVEGQTNPEEAAVNLRSESGQQSGGKSRPISDSFVACELYREKLEKYSQNAKSGDSNSDNGIYAVPPRPHSIFTYPVNIPSNKAGFLQIPDKLLNCSLSASMLNAENAYHGQRTSSNSSQDTSSTPPSPTEKPADWDDHFDIDLVVRVQQCEEVEYDSPRGLRPIDGHKCGKRVCGADPVTNDDAEDIEESPEDLSKLERQESIDSLSELPKSRTGSNTSTDSHIYSEVPSEAVTRDKRPSVATLYEEVSDDDTIPTDTNVTGSIHSEDGQQEIPVSQPPLPPRSQTLNLINGFNGSSVDLSDGTVSPSSVNKNHHHKHGWHLKCIIGRKCKRTNLNEKDQLEKSDHKHCNGTTKTGTLATAIKVSTETIGAGLFRSTSKKNTVKRVESAPVVGERHQNLINVTQFDDSMNETKEPDSKSEVLTIESTGNPLSRASQRFRSHTWPPMAQPQAKRHITGNFKDEVQGRSSSVSGAPKCTTSEESKEIRCKDEMAVYVNIVTTKDSKEHQQVNDYDYCYMKPANLITRRECVKQEIKDRLNQTSSSNDESEYVDMKPAVCSNTITCQGI